MRFHSVTSYSNATPFRIIFGKPSIGSIGAGEDLEMVDVADFFACIDVNPHGCHPITLYLFAARFSRRWSRFAVIQGLHHATCAMIEIANPVTQATQS